jgi:hypothetical protein
LCLQTENVYLVLVGLVHFGELDSEFIFGDVGTIGMEDVTVKTLLELQLQMRIQYHIRDLDDGHSIERQAELTRPSACGRAKGCG